jgi:hypothetical protein
MCPASRTAAVPGRHRRPPHRCRRCSDRGTGFGQATPAPSARATSVAARWQTNTYSSRPIRTPRAARAIAKPPTADATSRDARPAARDDVCALSCRRKTWPAPPPQSQRSPGPVVEYVCQQIDGVGLDGLQRRPIDSCHLVGTIHRTYQRQHAIAVEPGWRSPQTRLSCAAAAQDRLRAPTVPGHGGTGLPKPLGPGCRPALEGFGIPAGNMQIQQHSASGTHQRRLPSARYERLQALSRSVHVAVGKLNGRLDQNAGWFIHPSG